LDISLVFFIYGLAFFSMGLALLLEEERFPLLGESRIIIPLVIFGFIHGIHEWIEMFLNLPVWLTYKNSDIVNWLRIVLLTISFSSLIFFGLSILILKDKDKRWGARVLLGGVILLGLSIIAFGVLISRQHRDLFSHIDAIARYFIGVVGAFLAGWALYSLGRSEIKNERLSIGRYMNWAGLGFILYAITQTVVTKVDFFPASFWNTGSFEELTGMPIQIFRAGLAVWITVCILRMLNFAEKERAKGLLEAQQAKFDALERIRQELANREVMRQELIRKIMVTQDEERARISRELHDETAQNLTALSLNLAALKNKMDHNPEAEKIVAYLQKLSRQISIGIYQLIRDLRPIQLDELGLGPAIQYLADHALKNEGIKIYVQIKGIQSKLDPSIENVLFRVAQEAINNISRHSGVLEANIVLEYSQDIINMLIHDAGRGFIIENDSVRYGGLGIAGMRERVDSVGGTFALKTAPGIGTRIEVSVPGKSRNESVESVGRIGAG